MTSNGDVVELYSQLASVISRMLELARAKEWSMLPELDAQCTAIVDQLRARELHPKVAEADGARILALLDGIRAQQSELVALVQPQYLRLLQMIENLQRSRKLDRHYGTHHPERKA